MLLKHVLMVILSVICGISAVSGWAYEHGASRAPQSPVDVVTTYLQAWIDKDWQSMYDLLDADTKQALTLEQFREAFVLRAPLCKEESYFVPARFAAVELLREEGDTAVARYTLAFTKEGYMGKRLAQITDGKYRKTASNAEQYLMRLQALRLLAEVHNLRSRYVDVVRHALVAEDLQQVLQFPWQALSPKHMRGFYYYITAISDDTDEPKRADDGAYALIITHYGSPAGISYRQMLLRRIGDQWFITNAVRPLTDSLRSSHSLFRGGDYGNGVDEIIERLAQRLGLLD